MIVFYPGTQDRTFHSYKHRLEKQFLLSQGARAELCNEYGISILGLVWMNHNEKL